MRHCISCVLLALATILVSASLSRAAEMFSNSSDTISVAGNTVLTNQATYEATFLLNSTHYIGGYGDASGTGGGALIYNSWQASAEDEVLDVLNTGVGYGLAYPLTYPAALIGGTLTTGQWYDMAYVYDGSQERLYINGSEVASKNVTGTIGIGPNNIATVGAIFRDGFIHQGFIGELQSLRISNVGRYSGSSYSATLGDFTNDSSTELLYNFDTAPVGGIVPDLSGNGHTGTIGVGFAGATSPTFVPEPAIGSLMFGGVALLRIRRRNR